jgi:RHS repeat-associated protein
MFLWDRNGNLTNDGQRVFDWNEENRLTSIETTAAVVSNGMPKLRSEFLYDATGRRIQKVDYSSWNGTAYATTNTTRFTWDGWNLLSETISNPQSTITNLYVWGLDLSQSLQGAGGIGGLLCVIQNGTPYYPCFDGNGNITDYLDATGTVVAHYEYDPFGRTVAATGSKLGDFNFRFSTKYFEPFWNLYYYGLRYYSPELGRWMSGDPLVEEAFRETLKLLKQREMVKHVDKSSKYQFCGNAPISAIDSLGMVFDAVYRSWDDFASHAWVRVSYWYGGWYPQIPWPDQSPWQILVGVAGELHWPDPHENYPPKPGGKKLTYETSLKKDGELKFGDYKDKPCKCLDAKNKGHALWVQSCVENAAYSQKGAWHIYFANCRDRAQQWLSDCCLKVESQQPSSVETSPDSSGVTGGPQTSITK